MIIDDLIQGSDEWLRMRVGMCTGSRVGDVMAKRKKGTEELACRADYRKELVIERLTGLAYEHYVSKYMEWGTEQEPLARTEYELATGAEATPIGFAMHDRIKWFGASPDSLIGTDGVLEIKAPATNNHLDILLTGVIPEDYRWQMLAEMTCADRQWCDFVSFDPRLPKKFQLFIRRVHRDEIKIAEMELEVEKFLEEVDQAMMRLEACSPLTDDLTGILSATAQQVQSPDAATESRNPVAVPF